MTIAVDYHGTVLSHYSTLCYKSKEEGKYQEYHYNRPPDESVYWKIIFFISNPKDMQGFTGRNILRLIRINH